MLLIVLWSTLSSKYGFCTYFGILRVHLNAVILKNTMPCFVEIITVKKNVLYNWLPAIWQWLSKMLGNTIVTSCC